MASPVNMSMHQYCKNGGDSKFGKRKEANSTILFSYVVLLCCVTKTSFFVLIWFQEQFTFWKLVLTRAIIIGKQSL